MASVYEPVACLILQGAKQVEIGDRVLRYDHASYFVASLDLPAISHVIEASPARPYIAVALTLDRAVIADLIAAMPAASIGAAAGGHQGPGRSEEHTSELQSLMRISYAVFCLKKKIKQTRSNTTARDSK